MHPAKITQKMLYLCPMEEESGFIIDPQLDGEAEDAQLLHRSTRGFAEIWRVQKFGQFVVLKALQEEYRGDPVYEALLKKEFEIGYSLNHPSICRTWHFRAHPLLGNCVEMEWVDGVTLDERFHGQKPDEALFMKIANELCDAVGYLHSHQIVHRDIKPSNILITHNGNNLKLIDFGLADSDDSAILKMQAGTQAYIAPEVLLGGKADMRTDIWAVGKVLTELYRHSGGGHLSAGLLSGRHSGALRKACSTAPEDRFQQITELKDALNRRRLRPWAIVLIAIVAAAAVATATLMERQTAAEPEAVIAPDTTALASEKAAETDTIMVQKKPGTPKSPKTTSSTASKDDIDALFREATGLFE